MFCRVVLGSVVKRALREAGYYSGSNALPDISKFRVFIKDKLLFLCRLLEISKLHQAGTSKNEIGNFTKKFQIRNFFERALHDYGDSFMGINPISLSLSWTKLVKSIKTLISIFLCVYLLIGKLEGNING